MKGLLLIFIAISLVASCSSTPYAIIDGSRSKSSDQHNYDVIISGIDGKSRFSGDKVLNIEPGPHYVQLTSTKQGRRNEGTYQSWYFKAEPCMRYEVSAQHDENKRFSNNYWQVKVLKVEPILSCKQPKSEEPNT